MRDLIAAFVAAPMALAASVLLSVPASADPAPAPPPYIDHTEWVPWGKLTSLRVYPTSAGRQEASEFATAAVQGAQAWTEVLADAPDADTPGMREQFICHWQFAEKVQPGKTSWNLEPWRPVVSAEAMAAAGCNPGGSEEPF